MVEKSNETENIKVDYYSNKLEFNLSKKKKAIIQGYLECGKIEQNKQTATL